MLHYEEIQHDQFRLRYLTLRFKLDEVNPLLDFVKKHYIQTLKNNQMANILNMDKYLEERRCCILLTVHFKLLQCVLGKPGYWLEIVLIFAFEDASTQ